MSELVPKTICLPVDLAAYIEEQAGSNFQEKLISMLQGAKEIDAERKETMVAYEKQIREKRSCIDDLRHKIYDASELLRRLSSPLSYADRMMENNKLAEPGN